MVERARRTAVCGAVWVAVGLAADAAMAQGLAPAGSPAATVADDRTITVADPYVELHTGPGRGYPVAQVAARGERLVLLLRHTDWVQVRTERGVEGWVPRRQLQGSLVAAGAPTMNAGSESSPYAFEGGAAFGRFKGEPMLKGFVAWRFTPRFTLEGTVAQVQGLYAGTDLWHLDLHSEPWAGQRLSPSLGIGFGRLRNLPNASLVAGSLTDATLANVSLGLRWRVGERWFLRTDLTLHTVYLDSRRTGEYRSLTGGLAIPF